MENNEKNNKKAIITLVVGIGVLLVLIFSATFAYFSITSRNNFGTKTITAEAAQVGSVALTSGSNLTLNLTRAQMMKKSSDTSYYASASGVTTTETSPIIATATVTGEGTFRCNYTITITASATNNMYTAFQNSANKSIGQIILTVNGTKIDFYTANLFPSNKITYSGTISGITSSTALANRSLTAQLKFVNKNGVVQDDLQNTDITLTFSATAFSCEAVDPSSDLTNPSKPTYTTTGGYISGNTTSSGVATIISSSDNGTINDFYYSLNCGATWSKLLKTPSKSGTTFTITEPWTYRSGRNDTVFFRTIDSAGNISPMSEPFNIVYDS